VTLKLGIFDDVFKQEQLKVQLVKVESIRAGLIDCWKEMESLNGHTTRHKANASVRTEEAIMWLGQELARLQVNLQVIEKENK